MNTFKIGRYDYDAATIRWAAANDAWCRLHGPLSASEEHQRDALAWAKTHRPGWFPGEKKCLTTKNEASDGP